MNHLKTFEGYYYNPVAADVLDLKNRDLMGERAAKTEEVVDGLRTILTPLTHDEEFMAQIAGHDALGSTGRIGGIKYHFTIFKTHESNQRNRGYSSPLLLDKEAANELVRAAFEHAMEPMIHDDVFQDHMDILADEVRATIGDMVIVLTMYSRTVMDYRMPNYDGDELTADVLAIGRQRRSQPNPPAVDDSGY